MDGFVDAIRNSVAETNLITWIGTLTAVLYVILALKESIWCWAFGIISSALWVTVFFHEQLWYESILNVFYVALGIYGWIQWAKEKGNPADTNGGEFTKREVQISKITSKALLYSVAIATSGGIILGLISSSVSQSPFAYSDAMLASFSVAATWMTAKKYIENWVFWVVIDACSAALYIFKGPSMYLAAILFIFYTFMAAAGYFAWKKSLKA